MCLTNIYNWNENNSAHGCNTGSNTCIIKITFTMPDKGKQGSWTSFPKREYVNELIESQGEIPHWVVPVHSQNYTGYVRNT